MTSNELGEIPFTSRKKVERELPYGSDDGPALLVNASQLCEWPSAEVTKWHAVADFKVLEDGCWAIRVRSLFHGNRWCSWRTVRHPKQIRIADGWTATQVRDARRRLRAECAEVDSDTREVVEC